MSTNVVKVELNGAATDEDDDDLVRGLQCGRIALITSSLPCFPWSNFFCNSSSSFFVFLISLFFRFSFPTQENKSDNGSDQPTKSDEIPGNESTNGSDRSTLFSLYVLISILVNTREEFYTTKISYRIPIVGPNQIRWKILH